LNAFAPFLGWLSERYFYRCSDDSGSSRGPRGFARDLLSFADRPSHHLSPTELDRDLDGLLRRAGLSSRTTGGRSGAPDNAGARSRPLALLYEAFLALRHQSLTGLARRTLKFARPYLSQRRVGSISKGLERLGVDVRQVRARFPALSSYPNEWRPIRANEEELRRYARIWETGADPPEWPGRAAGDSTKGWCELRSAYCGQRLWILGPGWRDEQASTDRFRGEPIFALDEAEIDDAPSFFSTLDWKLATTGIRVPEVRGATFLPDRFRGLEGLPRDVLFFPTRRSGTFGDTVDKGFVGSDWTLEVALQIAAYLGFTQIRLLGGIHQELSENENLEARAKSHRFELLRAALVKRGVEIVPGRESRPIQETAAG